MTTDRALLADLFDRRQIRLRSAPFLDRPAPPKPPTFDWGCVAGMLLGLAAGNRLLLPEVETPVPEGLG